MGERPDHVQNTTASAVARRTIDGAECVKGGRTVWKFNIANREAKPFVHPLSLPDGRCVTAARPKDHPWHLGLWFCWKYINGVNYWEPHAPVMRNLFPDGMTVVKDVKVAPKGGACDVALKMWYGPRAEPGKVLMDEERVVSFSAPDEKGGYTIRSSHKFTAREQVTLDCRRPVGYGGFSLRMASLVRDFKVSGEGGTPDSGRNVAGPEGMKSVTYRDPATGHGVTMRVLKSIPSERIYTWADHGFANPVPMYGKPVMLKPGEKLELEYEVQVF
jgi:hypothetical protein